MAPVIEGLIVNGVTEILKKLLPQIGPVWNVKGDLQALQKTLEMILAVISDAQNRQVNENSVKLWLKRLRDVAYDAEDVLADFAYELMRRDHIVNLGGERDMVSDILLSVPVINNISFDYDMANKIKTINTNLDDLTKDMAKFGFNQLGSTSTTDHLQRDDQNNTDSYGDETEINVERENDISHIVDLLIKSHDGEKISVISIVGMGGIGKTTLAQQVYNHETVTKHFDLKIWVYISDRDIVVDKVSKDILNTVTGYTCDTPTTDVLVSRLRKELNGKKYLLVLDDFWDKNIGKWASLKRRLVVGAQGSKILVTTRSCEVASNVGGAISPHILQQISDEGCWSIIKHRAFSPGGAQESSNMIDLGKDIASKCGGVPLVAQTLGSLMHITNQQSDWLDIKDNPVMKSLENEIRIKELLKLSYDRLSPNLKQCFSYCSIFPRGSTFNRETMVQLWIAEGFVPSQMEEEGNKFLNILLNNSLLQTHSQVLDIEYKMHDLIYELAQSVSENTEFLNVKVSEMDAISNEEVRRLGVDFDKEEISTTFPKKLHTFLTFNARDRWASDCVFNSKYLRILSLIHPTITSSPRSFAKLKHLRYLSLSHCSLQEHDLTIGALYNLQTLLLYNCNELRSLPNDIGALKNLRHLVLSCCKQVEELPKSICSLSNLQFLTIRYCDRLQGLPSDIGNLKKLRIFDLTGSGINKLPDSINDCHDLKMLIVRSCENLGELPKDLGVLKRLRVLNISKTSVRDLPDSIIELKELTELHLGNCHPPKYIGNWTNLTSLRLDMYDVSGSHCAGGIGDLGGLNLIGGELMINYLKRVRGGGIEEAKRARLKEKSNITWLILNWQSPLSATNDDDDDGDVDENRHRDEDVLEGLQPHSKLKKMSICGYKGLKLPPWMTNISLSLPNLVKLELRKCNGIQQLGGFGQLRHLKLLTLDHLENLEEWIEEVEEAIAAESTGYSSSCHFPMLDRLVIKYCPKLITFPPTTFHCLENLIIEQVNAKLFDIKNITSLKHLRIWDFSDIGENRHLDEDILEGLQPHPNLINMIIDGYKGFKLPSWMTNISFSLPNLVRLKLRNCNGIQQLQGLGQLPNLKNLILYHLKNLEEWIEEVEETASCYFPKLVYLYIEYCPKLITFPTNFPCLVELTIRQVNAKVLNINNIITSLQHLHIVDFPQLEFLPRQIFHPRLTHLVIRECPNFQGFLPHIQDIDLQALEMIQILDIEWLHPQSDSTKKVIQKEFRPRW